MTSMSLGFLSVTIMTPSSQDCCEIKRELTQNKRKYLQIIFPEYRELLKLNNQKKKSNPFQKWAKYWNSHFLKEDTRMADKYIKRCSTSLIVRDCKLKPVRSHLVSIRTATIKTTESHKRWRGCGETETLRAAGGNVNGAATL